MNRHDNGSVARLDATRKRKAAESVVICLACAAAYDKPGGRTLVASPGCPTCGYVGWIGVAKLTRRDAAAPRELAGDRIVAFGQTETRASSSIDV